MGIAVLTDNAGIASLGNMEILRDAAETAAAAAGAAGAVAVGILRCTDGADKGANGTANCGGNGAGLEIWFTGVGDAGMVETNGAAICALGTDGKFCSNTPLENDSGCVRPNSAMRGTSTFATLLPGVLLGAVKTVAATGKTLLGVSLGWIAGVALVSTCGCRRSLTKD